MYLCTRKDTPSDVLNLPVLRLYRFRSDVVCLVLILRLRLLSYIIELIQVLLPVLLLLLLLVHAITSGIVCVTAGNVCKDLMTFVSSQMEKDVLLKEKLLTE